VLGIEVVGNGSLNDQFDLFIGTLGYETRSSHLARQGLINANRKIALAFPEEDYAAYLSNREVLKSAQFEVLPKDSGPLPQLLATAIENHPADVKREFSILVDISSMSRPMLADVVFELSMVERTASVIVTFVYLPAEFVKENAEHAPVVVTEPVTPDYAGWTSTPERPITAVVGLGYEHDLALGTIEYLEPTNVWVFVPGGEDRRYDDAVNQANRNLKEMLRDERVMKYNVDAPASGLTGTKESSLGFPSRLACASLRHAHRDIRFGPGRRSPASSDHRRRSEEPAEARLACPDRASDRRWHRHLRHHDRHRQVEDMRVALAGTVHGGRRRRAAERPDAACGQGADRQGQGRRGGSSHLGAAGGRGDPLDGQGDGESCRNGRLHGPGHLEGAWPGAAPLAQLQAVQ